MTERYIRIRTRHFQDKRKKIIREHIVKMLLTLVALVLCPRIDSVVTYSDILNLVVMAVGIIALIWFAIQAFEDPRLAELNKELEVVDRDRILMVFA